MIVLIFIIFFVFAGFLAIITVAINKLKLAQMDEVIDLYEIHLNSIMSDIDLSDSQKSSSAKKLKTTTAKELLKLKRDIKSDKKALQQAEDKLNLFYSL